MGLYHENQSRDNCGFGLIAQMDGIPSHTLIQRAIEALNRMTHRGAIAADGKSGDGCGILMQLPESYFRQVAEESNFHLGEKFAVGQIFLNQDERLANRSREILFEELQKETLTIVGWRSVDTNPTVCGKVALQSLPKIEQVFVKAPPGWPKHDLERRLFIARRRTSMRCQDDPMFYVCSLSCLVIAYKGLVMPEALPKFYRELSDPRLESAICVFHQRFSTNTLPNWKYAQPFRFLAHNGEINTIAGNRAWAIARQKKFVTPLLPDLQTIKPMVNQSGSDSSSLDNMLEVFLAGGLDIFRAMRLLVPPAWQNQPAMDPDLRAFYEFNSMHMEPWDGPAGIVMTDGRLAACNLDRNGLRPARYVITQDNMITLASEIGVWDYKPEEVVEKGRVGPGEMLAVDTQTGKLWRSDEIDNTLKSRHPYRAWLDENTIRVQNNPKHEAIGAQRYIDQDIDRLPEEMKRFNISREERESVIKPMAQDSVEATGSMGDDTPIAVLSKKARNIYDYFRQNFAQVTNPPIDPLREKLVMSLETCIGREHNVFQETTGHAHRVIIESPVLNYAKMQKLLSLQQEHYQHKRINLNFNRGGCLKTALQKVGDMAVKLAQEGAVILILSDRDTEADQVPMPAAFATSAVHQRLVAEGLRCDVNIIVETGSARDAHHFAVLVGLGATAIYPYLAYRVINDLQLRGEILLDRIKARENYRAAIHKGLLKILSKMGISTIASYRGAALFDIIGFHQEIHDLCFPNTTSRIQGATFEDINRDLHVLAKNARIPRKPITMGGDLKYVHGGEYHAYNPDVVTLLQKAVKSGNYSDYLGFSNVVNQRGVAAIRDLFKVTPSGETVSIEDVEPENAILQRFDSAGMSIGALSTEAHEALAVAMNRLSGRSNSGEGGEDPSRFNSERNSKIKQIASGRFGVTAHYLVNAEVIQIKVAQGAKPGEGGQLPGHKVTAEIATLRYATPGVTLISPPPHHDIYSIEDLAQLIFDLKQVNPTALISVKLVAGTGVGTIAAGVAKAYADLITIAGHDGGTGASPLTSVKYAGSPWEIGLAEAQQALVANGLRGKIRLQVDGGLKTGLDVIKGAILGAESFGFGTAPMIALGCKYLRICHLNNCATGVATQDSQLRSQHFRGLPEMVMNYFQFVARETREWMAKLGVKQLTDLIGRTDLLEILPGETAKQSHLDLNVILQSAQRQVKTSYFYQETPNNPYDQGELNQHLLRAASPYLENNESANLRFDIKNFDRSVGASLAGKIAKTFGREGFQKCLAIHFTGTGGQSFGAWNHHGMHLSVEGDSNDYVGKGMMGGSISLYPPENSRFVAKRTSIIGNTCLYGATGGKLFARGCAGERFAVRNSGAIAVIEGIGDHGCEYMTGGVIAVLGTVGNNFGAGMTGGFAYVLDLNQQLQERINTDSVDFVDLDDPQYTIHQEHLKNLIQEHIEHTHSQWGQRLLANFEHFLFALKLVKPKASEMSELLKTDSKLSDQNTIALTLVK
ncbi:MAG: glutamate synthase large subunit [Pseudomonadota bacterium]